VKIQPDEGPTVISTTTTLGTIVLQTGQRVTFDFSFSAKGPLAEHLQIP
jgi:cold shock CspA family protein